MKTPRATGQLVLRNVLFATDFSAAVMRALPYAANPAGQYGAKPYASSVVPIESYLLGEAQAIERLRVARTEAEFNVSELVAASAPPSGPLCCSPSITLQIVSRLDRNRSVGYLNYDYSRSQKTTEKRRYGRYQSACRQSIREEGI